MMKALLKAYRGTRESRGWQEALLRRVDLQDLGQNEENELRSGAIHRDLLGGAALFIEPSSFA